MNSLNLKLQSSVNNILLPKLEEIVLGFTRKVGTTGACVIQIISSANISFEVVNGSITLYPASSSTDVTIGAKTEYAGSVPSGFVLVIFTPNSKLRLLPTLSTGSYIRRLLVFVGVDGSSYGSIESLETLPYNSYNCYGIQALPTPPVDIDINDIINVNDSMFIYFTSGFVYMKGTLIQAHKTLIDATFSNVALFTNGNNYNLQIYKPITGTLNLDIGCLPNLTWYVSTAKGALSNGTLNIIFDTNYGGSNWLSGNKYSTGWTLNLQGCTLIDTTVVDKIIIELARQVGANAPLTNQFKLHGVRSSASDTAWATIAARWNLTEAGVFV